MYMYMYMYMYICIHIIQLNYSGTMTRRMWSRPDGCGMFTARPSDGNNASTLQHMLVICEHILYVATWVWIGAMLF